MSWTLIEHKAAPASNMFDFTGDFSAFDKLMLVLDDVTVSADGANLLLQLSTAATLRTSGYRRVSQAYSSGGSDAITSSNSDSSVLLTNGSTSNWGVGNAAGECFSGIAAISGVDAAVYKGITADVVFVGPTAAVIRAVNGGLLEQTGDVDGVRVTVSSGNINAGKATLYGLATS
jgi:hypothetical protein